MSFSTPLLKKWTGLYGLDSQLSKKDLCVFNNNEDQIIIIFHASIKMEYSDASV